MSDERKNPPAADEPSRSEARDGEKPKQHPDYVTAPMTRRGFAGFASRQHSNRAAAMRLALEKSDFQRLSPEAQKELIGFFAGRPFVEADEEHANTKHHWRRPMDITPDQAGQLLHGLGDLHRLRLTLMAQQDGRASVAPLPS